MRASYPVCPEDCTPSGIIIDGAWYALGGQPPIAVSHGWGLIGWARQWWRW
jgi:hypothetical protein